MACTRHELVSQSSGGWKAEIGVSAPSASGEGPQLLTVPSHAGKRASELYGVSYKGASPIYEGSPLVTSSPLSGSTS